MWTLLLQLTMVFVLVGHRVASAQRDCGNTSFSGSDGVVSSPNFPLPYPHDISCTYSIDVGQNNSVLLKFLNFDLELPVAGNCAFDWLMISCKETDDENLDFRKRYCGTTVPRTSLRFFNCPVVELKFFADSSVSGGGFSIEYNVIEYSTSADSKLITDLDCGETIFTSSSGYIRLPSNPTEYSATVNCIYTVSTDHKSTFLLGVASLQLPDLLDSFGDCSRDYVMVGCVSDGETELNPTISDKYCRSSFTDDPIQHSRFVFSDCSMVKISIHSSDYNYRGTNSIPFTVTAYDDDCAAASFTGPTGIITSPRFPLPHPHSLNCLYSINIDRTKTATLHFLSFSLEGSSYYFSEQCSYDWLTISCLSTGFVPPAYPSQNKKYCGQHTKQMTLTYSNCDSLTLNFRSDSSVAKGGFAIQYTITSSGNATTSTPGEERGNVSFTGVNGVITSPRFPLSYPNNADYVYSIDVDRTKTVGLFFYSFNLEGTSHDSYMDSCNHDWLLINCSSDAVSRYYYHQNRKYCGAKTTPLLLSYTNCESLTLNFVSDSSVTSGGFNIWYSISSTGQSSCGNTSFSGPNGVITSPNFPLRYPYNFGCTYSINVDRKSSVQLRFKYFNMGVPNAAGYCTHDWVKITCNETTKSNPYSNKKFCGAIQWTSSMRFVDCQNLKLQFSSGASANRNGFMIEYTVVDDSSATDDNTELDCGTTLFTNSTGVISLPRNPTNFLAKVNCTYTISTNKTSLIWLDTDFSTSAQLLQSFQDCNRENLAVDCVSEEATTMNSRTARVFCRRGSSATYIPRSPLAFEDCRTLKLSIFSNTYDNQETFRIPFFAIGSNDVCGDTSFSALTGIVATPQLEYQLSRPVNCQYTIDVGNVGSVVISIDRLNFGYQYSYYSDDSCRGGWLTITCLLNGPSIAHPIAGRRLCQTLFSSMTARFPACQTVLIHFSSNDTSIDKGFSMRYRIGDYELDCGSTLFNGSSGDIILPRNPTNYPATVNCTYTISTNRTGHILLDIFSISYMYSNQFFSSFQDCSTDNLTVGCVSEGGTELNPDTTRVFCHNSTSPFYYISESDLVFYDCSTLKMTIRSNTYGYYSADEYTPRFHFSVYGLDEICGQTSFSALSGIVATQRLLFDHMRRVSCLYTIDSGHVNSVVLSIDRLNLGSENDISGSCSSGGWLTITCMSDAGASVAHPLAERKLCGYHESTVARFSACRSVVLNFSSDHTSFEKGITIRYRLGDYDADCGNTSFSGSTGFITSPRFPLSYAHNLNCLYSIAGGDRKAITLSFDSFRLGGRSNTPLLDSCRSSDYLTVSCSSDESVVANFSSMRRYCGIKTTPLTFAFPSCAAVVLNFRSDSYRHDSTEEFKVRYTVVDTDTSQAPTTSTPTTSASEEIPVTIGAKCEVDCKLNADGATCDCSTASSDSIVGGNRNQDQVSSTFLPLTPILIGDKPSSSSNSINREIEEDIQAGL